MASSKRRWLPIVAGILVLCAVVIAGGAIASVLYFRDRVQITRGTGRADAMAQLDAARRRFPDPRPLLVMGDDRRPRFTEGLAEHRNPGAIEAVHVLAWDADDGAFVNVSVPMWLLRLKSGPIGFGEYMSGLDDHGVRLEPKDLDRYGPGVIIDIAEAGGDLVLLTAQ